MLKSTPPRNLRHSDNDAMGRTSRNKGAYIFSGKEELEYRQFFTFQRLRRDGEKLRQSLALLESAYSSSDRAKTNEEVQSHV